MPNKGTVTFTVTYEIELAEGADFDEEASGIKNCLEYQATDSILETLPNVLACRRVTIEEGDHEPPENDEADFDEAD